MTATNKNWRPTAGEQVHFLTATTIATGVGLHAQATVVERGTTITLTDAMIEASRDRNGWSWFDIVGDEQAQIERWGARRAAPGPWPEGDEVWSFGDPVWEVEREQARAVAFSKADESERVRLLREVQRRYGSKPTNIQTATYAADN